MTEQSQLAPVDRRPGGQQLPAVIQLLEQPNMMEQIKRALPRHLTPERFSRMVLTTLRKTPKLALCDQLSFLSAMMELAQLGLEPGTPLGHAWMLPYGSTVQVIIGYKGMIALAERGSRISMNAEVMYEGDEFEYALGSEPFIRHKPCEDLAKRGALVYAYSVARFPDGRPTHFKVVTRADIDEAKSSSSAYQRDAQKLKSQKNFKPSCPWFTSEPAMWRKTAIRRHASFLPLSAEFARATELDSQYEAAETQKFLPTGFDLAPLPPPQSADDLEGRVKAEAEQPAEEGAA